MAACLYDRDLAVWVEQQIAYLKAREYNKLDIDNLLEELESVGKTERRSMESYFEVMIAHLLKWNYQPSNRCKSWASSINQSRRRILRLLKDSPSLKNYMDTAFKDAFNEGRRTAIEETGMKDIPLMCPFNVTYAMDEKIDF